MTHDAPREIRVNIPGDLAQMAWVTQQAAGLLEESSVPARASYAAQLVLEELITNIINHAHDDCAVHHIGVRVALETGYVVVEIEDDGRPFDPATIPDADVRAPIQDRSIGGLGLHLIRQMAEAVDYTRTGAKNRLKVRIPL